MMLKITKIVQVLLFISCLVSPEFFYQSKAANNQSVVEEKNLTTLTLHTEINHPYVYYKEGTKELTGIAYEIVVELLDRANFKANIIVSPWLRAVRLTKNDSNSCLFIMNRTVQREPDYLWVGPMIVGGIAIYKKPGSPIVINSLRALTDYIVVGKKDSVSVMSLKSKYNINVIYSSSDEQAAKLLYKDRAQLWAAGVIDGPLATKKLGLPKPEVAFVRGVTDLSMGCSVNLLPEKFNTLFEQFKTMDKYRQKVINKYLGKDS